jgi:cation-dependent mannose-6-phosphate receptor
LNSDKDKRSYGDDSSFRDYGRSNSKSSTSSSTKDASTVVRRKSAIISFRCDRDPANTVAKLSFLEVDEDECTYVFSILSQHACAKTEPHKPGSVGPGSVFAIIFFVAVIVYIVGGIFYQRTVAHARGWRQLPNYSLWASIWGVIEVCTLILLLVAFVAAG